MEKTALKEVKLRPRELHVDYDSASDVLYISFGEPQPAYDSTLPEDGVIYRLNGNQLVGMSVLNFRGKTRYRRAKN
jgi:uncharacterized protein YuzE